MHLQRLNLKIHLTQLILTTSISTLVSISLAVVIASITTTISLAVVIASIATTISLAVVVATSIASVATSSSTESSSSAAASKSTKLVILWCRLLDINLLSTNGLLWVFANFVHYRF